MNQMQLWCLLTIVGFWGEGDNTRAGRGGKERKGVEARKHEVGEARQIGGRLGKSRKGKTNENTVLRRQK